MISIFNTTFEISLRVLLTLEAAPRLWRTADMIAATDFITVYGRDFDIADENLHGDNTYKFSEFALRRERVKEAIKTLVLDGFIEIHSTQDGFMYALSQDGSTYCEKFDSDYAHTYRTLAKKAYAYTNGKSDRKILELINRRSVYSLQRGERNG